MSSPVELWSEVLPIVKNAVTGTGVWSALNQAKAVAYEDDIFVLGMPHEVGELAGHLRMQQTKVLIERHLSQKIGSTVHLRVIDGTTMDDWALVKRKEQEAQRMQTQQFERAQAEHVSRASWDQTYDQISRAYAAVPNKSLAQNRAKFYVEALQMIREAVKKLPIEDESGERNFARCLERVATYAEVPATMVALDVLGSSSD